MTAAICLGTRVRLKKGGKLGTVQFEAELVPPATSTGAWAGMTWSMKASSCATWRTRLAGTSPRCTTITCTTRSTT